MAKEYGGRYRNLNKGIGGGAQGDVLLVSDDRDPAKREYALKRLKKLDRLGRFQAEIRALKQLAHPNIVPIFDHSDEGLPGDQNHKHWFVMPIASGTLESRVALYENNLDAVLQVSIGLVSALEAAHAAGIVHRDVKPANILFPRMDHHVWLADFGICHYAAAKDRLSETGEVVGPRGFTAPELEVGNPVDIPPSADLYSIGKVIYFMLSGGRRVAREQLDSPEYLATFAKGERYGLLQTLLSRMITTVERRVRSAAEVRQALTTIHEWEQHAHSLALSPSTLAKIAAVHQDAIYRQTVTSENNRIVNERKATVEGVAKGIVAWLDLELQKIAAHLTSSGTHEVAVTDATWLKDRNFVVDLREGAYIGIIGKQIDIMDKSSSFSSRFVLKFFVCEFRKISFSFGGNPPAIKATEPKMAVVPFVIDQNELDRMRPLPGVQKPWHMGGFIQDKFEMEKSRLEAMRRIGNRHQYSHQPQVSASFVGFSFNVAEQFSASEWPEVVGRLREMLSSAVEAMLDWSTSNPRTCGR